MKRTKRTAGAPSVQGEKLGGRRVRAEPQEPLHLNETSSAGGSHFCGLAIRNEACTALHKARHALLLSRLRNVLG